MKRIWIVVAVLLLLTASAAAYEIPADFSELSLEAAVAEYLEQGDLGGKNIAISYYNTVTGESYAHNADQYMVAASTYKLPLNMYFYEMENAGEINPDEIFPTAGIPLTDIHRQSIVYSNNEISEAMILYFGRYQAYREAMQEYVGAETVDPVFYTGEYYTADMMMSVLKHLYDNSTDFEALIAHMKEARPGEFFKAGVKDYEVAHKYGVLPSVVNDVGIIYTPQPFLLAVFTEDTYGDIITSELAELFTTYNLWQEAQTPAEEAPPAEEEPVVEEVAPPAEEPVTEEEPEEETPRTEKKAPPGIIQRMKMSDFPWWVLAVLALLLLVVLLRFL